MVWLYGRGLMYRSVSLAHGLANSG